MFVDCGGTSSLSLSDDELALESCYNCNTAFVDKTCCACCCAAMKRQRIEQTSARDVRSCGTPVQRARRKLKPSLPTFPGGLMQARYLESPSMEMCDVPNKSKKEQTRMASMCEHQRQRSTCKECKGSGICPHQRQRSTCKECKG